MSSLQNKMYNYEVAPPQNAWEKITAALDESHIDNEFPAKLYNTEATPPASAWDKIINSLDEEHAKVVPMPRKSFPLFRYAAAVVVIGIITFGIVKWTGSKSGSEELVNTKNLVPANENIAEPNENNIADKNTPKENVQPEESNTYTATTDEVKAPRIKRTKNNYQISDYIEPAEAIYAYNEHTPNLAERYIMLMTPNGIVRMSKKLGNIVCCVAGEEQDDECKDQLKKWQEKIAASPVAPAPGNFMDILSLVSSLDENEL